MFDRLQALQILAECTGEDLWSVEHCRLRKVPSAWIAELADCYESGFQHDRQTIYVDQQVVNQYHGVRDVDLAIKVGEYLGVDVNRLADRVLSRVHLVRAIRQAAEDDE